MNIFPLRYALCPDRIFTGLDGYTLQGYAVLVENEDIAGVVPAESLPEDAFRVPLPGMTVLPGLIDTHVHLDDWMMPLFLSHGITTVRDTGNDPEWIFRTREMSRDPGCICPSVLCCGPVLDRAPSYHREISMEIRDVSEMKDAIKFLYEKKADAVKLYEGLDHERVSAGIKEAGKYHMHVLGHFEVNVPLADAVKAGIGETEHLAGIPPRYSQDIVESIRENGVWTVPTQIVYEQVFEFIENERGIEKLLQFVPDSVPEYWRSFRRIVGKPYGEYRNLFSCCENHRKYLSALIASKAKIAAGSDSPYQFSLPGYSLLKELRILSECGMNNDEVLRCATARGAELLGVINETGTLETGKKADMTVVRGDPVKSIDDIENTEMVIKKGHKYEPEELLKNPVNRPLKSRLDRMFGMYTEIYARGRDQGNYE